MIFKLACGDVMPGCSARFENTNRAHLMNDIAQHAATHHGITTITPDITAALDNHIQTAAS
ncbi:Predicted small metal-binding protein [Friedmanniella luteola]|uniref:Predicted small metal-binding protein n=1 Tax=Friedmanniella luteola TaxID=546871 RepID=A0A1H1RH90_9ACTN|nr:DUF1059 domain-containing protein [Friedmanniella luteola]SDS35068.1 Predicted small metal-binding protein [Friedmanniella luteola]